MGFLSPKPATTSNQAYGTLANDYSGQIGEGTHANNFLSALLTGQGDTAGANAAWGNYKQQAGYAPALAALQSGVTQGGAASGLLNSGATDKALVTKGQQLDQSTYGNFLQSLSGLSGLGLQAGGTLAGAGSTSTGASPSAAGSIGSLAGGLASIFSDPRLKVDAERVGEFSDGLGVWTFRYFDDDEIRIGVMADEVADIRPWALGPTIGGFSTVNYQDL